MIFRPYQAIEEVEVQHAKISKTYKTYWDPDTRGWKNTWIYRIPRRRESEEWLKTHYGNQYNSGPTGWYPSFDRLIIGEKIYLHYCLAKPE